LIITDKLEVSFAHKHRNVITQLLEISTSLCQGRDNQKPLVYEI